MSFHNKKLIFTCFTSTNFREQTNEQIKSQCEETQQFIPDNKIKIINKIKTRSETRKLLDLVQIWCRHGNSEIDL